MTVREGGIIRDGFDETVDMLRSAKRDGKQWLAQLRRGIALCVGQGLLADIVLWHQVLIGIGDFKIIAEDLVVFDFQVLDARPLSAIPWRCSRPSSRC